MNIHINKEKYIELLSYSKYKFHFGSHLYGLNNINSDIDYMYIYETPKDWNDILINYNINHQFQYKEKDKNIDHIFTSEEQFWRNLFNGDSTINCDILLFNNEFNEMKQFSDDYKLKLVRTYKIIKSYLGFAKRDLNKVNEGEHRLKHGFRCLYMAKTLMNNKLPTLIELRNNLLSFTKNDLNLLKEEEIILRKRLNIMLESNEIKHYYIPYDSNNLLDILLNSINITEFKYEK